MLVLKTFDLEVKTTAGTDILNLTEAVQERVRQTGVTTGLLTLFIAGSTAALTTTEYESGAVHDLKAASERLFPPDLDYAHDLGWGDGNGSAQVRAAFLKPSLSLPVEPGPPQLGTWQQIVRLDFDHRPRQRQIRGQFLGFQPANR